MKLVRWAVIAFFSAQFGGAQAKDCPGADSAGGPPFFSTLMGAMQRNPPPNEVDCNSVLTVIGKVKRSDKVGGRKLEKDKPFDPVEAQANLDSALQDPEIRTRIEKIRSEIKDEDVRLVYEAATFDEEGYYDARELIIQRLRQKHN